MWMIEIGANTPAMIKSMTAEVESRNLIVASMHCARKRLLWHVPRQQVLAFASS